MSYRGLIHLKQVNRMLRKLYFNRVAKINKPPCKTRGVRTRGVRGDRAGEPLLPEGGADCDIPPASHRSEPSLSPAPCSMSHAGPRGQLSTGHSSVWEETGAQATWPGAGTSRNTLPCTAHFHSPEVPGSGSLS